MRTDDLESAFAIRRASVTDSSALFHRLSFKRMWMRETRNTSSCKEVSCFCNVVLYVTNMSRHDLKVNVMCSQVHNLHIHSSEHIHTVDTHPGQWAAICCSARAAVECLAQGPISRGYWSWKRPLFNHSLHVHFLLVLRIEPATFVLECFECARALLQSFGHTPQEVELEWQEEFIEW